MGKISFPFVGVVRRGSVRVKIYFTPSRGCDAYTLSYWQDEVRKQPTFSDFKKAKTEAECVAFMEANSLEADRRCVSHAAPACLQRDLSATFPPPWLREW